MKKNVAIVLIIIVIIFLAYLQIGIYRNKFVLQEDKTAKLENEIFELSSLYEKLSSEMEVADEDYKKLDDENNELVIHNEELENKLLEMKYDLVKNNLPDYWHNIWDSIYKSEGLLTDKQIEEINFLLQPIFSYNDCFEVSPLSCFFTSCYEDVRDINLVEFLRYCPNGEVPEELLEFEELKKHKNWPFGDADSILSLPVPIRRYNSELVQELFTVYAGINLDGLTGVGFDEVIYLESTDAYYNYTSDLGPGYFRCTEGIVEDGVIKLYGDSRSKSVLIIAKNDEKYVIESFYSK